MFLLRKPSDTLLRAFLAEQAPLEFSYPSVRGTACGVVPPGYQSDHARFRLGNGAAVFAAATVALRQWRQFDLGWTRAYPDDTPIQPGNAVAVVARTLGIWSVSSARIIYLVDEPDRFGFAYGTLPGHVESGEERFLVEQAEDGSVWYDISAFSRPRHPLAKIANPYVRWLQQRFRKDSAAALRRVAASQRPQ